MTIWVIRDGELVEKSTGRKRIEFSFPTPHVSRIEPYESPITGKEITSWGERDREMKDNDCYDPRDLPKDVQWKNKERRNARSDLNTGSQWFGTPEELARGR